MEFKKLDKYQYEIINNDYIIYICKEKNPDTEYYLYFVDVFLKANDEAYDNEIFDDMSLAVDYVNNNYTISEKIYNNLNKNNNG